MTILKILKQQNLGSARKRRIHVLQEQLLHGGIRINAEVHDLDVRIFDDSAIAQFLRHLDQPREGLAGVDRIQEQPFLLCHQGHRGVARFGGNRIALPAHIPQVEIHRFDLHIRPAV